MVVQLVFMLLSEIYNRLIIPLLFNYLFIKIGLSIGSFNLILSTISSFFGLISFIIMIFWVVYLSKLYQTSGDSSVRSARNLFLGGFIWSLISILLNIVGLFLFSISEEIYFIVVHYLPSLVINLIYIFAWIKLLGHFKTTLASNNGRIGCILIIFSVIPSILTQVVKTLLTLLLGPEYSWGNSNVFVIIILLLSVTYLGIIIKIIGYILMIKVFKKANTQQSPMTPISLDGTVKNNISPGEPTLNTLQYCTQCGSPTVPGADFCNNCGNKM